MEISIVNPRGVVYSGSCEYVVASGNNGQLAILENHIPVVVPIKDGFVKRVDGKDEYYYKLTSGLLEHSNNVITIIAQEVGCGNTLEEAISDLEEIRKTQKEKNYHATMDYAKIERDLAKNIKDIKASSL